MKGGIAAHVLANKANSTPPPKHIFGKPVNRSLSIEKLIEECAKVGADPHKVLALALTDQARVDAKETGMTLKEQANIAWKLVDKAEPSKQAIKHSGDDKEPLYFKFSTDDEEL